jgi:hypothetical protein
MRRPFIMSCGQKAEIVAFKSATYRRFSFLCNGCYIKGSNSPAHISVRRNIMSHFLLYPPSRRARRDSFNCKNMIHAEVSGFWLNTTKVKEIEAKQQE